MAAPAGVLAFERKTPPLLAAVLEPASLARRPALKARHPVVELTIAPRTQVAKQADTGQFPSAARFAAERAPGVALTAVVASSSVYLSKNLLAGHLSPLLWATVLGMVVGNTMPERARSLLSPGIKFSKARLLRAGIILYGLKLTLQQISAIGAAGIVCDVFVVVSTLLLGAYLGGRVLRMDDSLSMLISSGAAICGCSAVLAAQPVVGGESHQVSAAVGTVVLCGSVSMFLYPLLWRIVPCLGASAKLMGVYTGSTIHEVAGVVAAGNAMTPEIATTAVVTKLARVMLLAPALTALSTIRIWRFNRRARKLAKAHADHDGAGVDGATTVSASSPAAPSAGAGAPMAAATSGPIAKAPVPWFAFAFVAVAAANSMVTLPPPVVKAASTTSAYMLACAMAALGVDTRASEMKKLGPKPLILAGTLWAWLLGAGFLVARSLVGVA